MWHRIYCWSSYVYVCVERKKCSAYSLGMPKTLEADPGVYPLRALERYTFVVRIGVFFTNCEK